MHDAAYEWVLRHAIHASDTATVLELGGRNVNGTTRPLFPSASRYVSVDINAGPDVDVVADAAEVDLGEQFDVVVSTELMEHTPRGAEIVANAAAHLVPGGMFVATMAGPGRAEHGAGGEPSPPPGEFYRNVSPDELTEWLTAAGFDRFEVDQLGTDVRCVAWR